MEGQPAQVWLTCTCGVEKQEPAAQLVALAAQACKEMTPASAVAIQPDMQPESVFTERIMSLQVLVVGVWMPLKSLYPYMPSLRRC